MTRPPNHVKTFAIRLALVLVSLATMWATGPGFDRWQVNAKANFDYNILSGLPWVMGFVLAGFFFGCACWIPRRFAFDVRTAVAIGFIPLLGIIHPFAVLNLRWWPSVALSLSMSWIVFFGFLFGIAIAAGFGEAPDEQPPTALPVSDPRT